MGSFRAASEREGISFDEEMLVKKGLLMQHGDMSGTWTAEQKKMIEEMGMKPE